MLEQMVGCKYQFPDDLDLSGEVKDLIKRMLAPEPHKYVCMMTVCMLGVDRLSPLHG